MSLRQSAPEISTKPLARALRKFAAQRNCLTISSVSQTRSRQNAELGRTVYCVARPLLPWRVLEIQVQQFKIGDARSSVVAYRIMKITEHRKAYAATPLLAIVDRVLYL